MSMLVVILFIIIVAFIGFLYTPIEFYIDTDQSRYEVFQLPLFHFSVIHSNDSFFPRARLLGINIQLARRQKKSRTKIKGTKPKGHFDRSLATWSFLVTRVFRSFKVNHALFDIDSGDVIINAQLIPLFMAVSGKHVQVKTNFTGRVYFHLEMSNQPAKLLWIFIQFLIKK